MEHDQYPHTTAQQQKTKMQKLPPPPRPPPSPSDPDSPRPSLIRPYAQGLMNRYVWPGRRAKEQSRTALTRHSRSRLAAAAGGSLAAADTYRGVWLGIGEPRPAAQGLAPSPGSVQQRKSPAKKLRRNCTTKSRRNNINRCVPV